MKALAVRALAFFGAATITWGLIAWVLTVRARRSREPLAPWL